MTSQAAQCALNNALWCDSVCRAHGLPGEFLTTLWLNRRPVPRFYSNVVTLSPNDRAGQRAWVEHLLTRRPGFSVKDSFAALDLSTLGFSVLFEASWLWREAGPVSSEREAASTGEENKVRRTSKRASHRGGLSWSVVGDAAGLARWEAAWAGLHAGQRVAGSERIFRTGLLHTPGVVLLAGARDGAVVAVAAANRTGNVVGLSNVFAPADAADVCWAGAVASVNGLFPGLPIVGYELGDDLAQAQAVGFRPVGPLRVWVRS